MRCRCWIAGSIIDRLGTKKGYSWAIVIWSLAAIVHAFAIPIGEGLSSVLGWTGITVLSVSVIGFMFSRAILAFGEAGNFRQRSRLLPNIFRKERSPGYRDFNSGANVERSRRH